MTHTPRSDQPCPDLLTQYHEAFSANEQVSALVARFQTASDHNAATAQRERDASRRSSASSNTGAPAVAPGVGVGVTTGGTAGWRRSGTFGSAVVSSPQPGAVSEGMVSNGTQVSGVGSAAGVKQGNAAAKGDEEVKAPELEVESGGGMEVLKDKVGEVVDKVKGLVVSDTKKAEESAKADAADSPSSKSKSRMTATNGDAGVTKKRPGPVSTTSPLKSAAPSAKPARSPTAAMPSTSPTARTRAAPGSVADAQTAGPPSATKKAAVASNGSSKGAAGGGRPAAAEATEASRAPTAKVPSPTTAKSVATTTRKTASSDTTTPRATSKSAVPPKSIATPASASKPSTATPSAQKSTTGPPSAFRTPKPLVPAKTGPAGSATSLPRSASVTGTSLQHASPLRPQMTGTPIKPTASSLAKARTTPHLTAHKTGNGQGHTLSASSAASEAAPQTMSVGRAAGKRMSMGPGSTLPRSARATTASPVSKRDAPPSATSAPPKGAGEGSSLQRKSTVSGSASTSRLMQGTAASRAKAVAAHAPSQEAASPAKKAVPSPKKSTAGRGRKGSEGEGEGSQPPSPTTARSAKSVVSATALPKSQPREEKGTQRHAAQHTDPVEGGGEHLTAEGAAAVARPSSDTPAGHEVPRTTGDAPPVVQEDEARMDAVGDSPIGRIGLPAVDSPSLRKKSDAEVGQHPVIAAVPGEEVGAPAAQPTPPADSKVIANDAGSASGEGETQDGNQPHTSTEGKERGVVDG